MEQTTNYKHKNDFLISNVVPSSEQIQKHKFRKCNECNKRRKPSEENNQFCRNCYIIKTVFRQKLSGNKIIDEFIRHTQINLAKEDGKMEFIPYEQFQSIEFIAEGGFSKIYKAIWIDGPLNYGLSKRDKPNYPVALKKLNNSKNFTTKELNEVYYTILY